MPVPVPARRRAELPRIPQRTIRLRLTVLYGLVSVLSAAGLLAITITLADGWQRGTAPVPPAPAGTAASGQAALARAEARIALLQAQVNQAGVAWSHRLMFAAVAGLGVMAGASAVLGWVVAGRALRPLRAITAATRQISEDDLDRRLALSGPRDELTDLADTIDGLLARLQAAFDAQRNFVANASHELRTPLSASRTMLEVALADPAAPAAALRSVCQDVLAEGQQQERLIDALLTLARSQRGLDRREPADLAGMTAEVLRAREADAARRGVTVRASMTAAPVLGDERLVRQLAANLIDNALRHNLPGGNLSVDVASGRGRSTFTITNTGPVIPAAQVGRLFQPFQRLSAQRAAGDHGLGLGLAIVAAIARAHQATLTVSPGRCGGLDIRVSFPAAAAIP
jgi:signal transduction histidine kinase